MTNIVLFDLGGTLVDDPFQDTLRLLQQSWLVGGQIGRIFSTLSAQEFVNAWQIENDTYNFPLASHFLQEEIWINRAFHRIGRNQSVQWDIIPVTAAQLLAQYRDVARQVIASQPQLSYIRRALEILRANDFMLGVASNDKETSARAMLCWAGLDRYFQWIFTSEGFSTPLEPIEKPNKLFFTKIDQALDRSGATFKHKIFVGDNERNDIERPNSLGYIAVRYINRNARATASWLDPRTTTQASYKYDHPNQLIELFSTIMRDLKSR